MDYFMIRQSGTITIPKAPPEESAAPEDPSVRAMIDLSLLDKFDYLAIEHLFSDPLKQVIEQYLPEQLWRPCVFIHPQKKEQKTFWFLPPLPYQPKQVTFASNGLPAAIAVEPQDFCKKAPGIFRIRSPKGSVSIVVHLSIAESILRRGICGLELVKLSA